MVGHSLLIIILLHSSTERLILKGKCSLHLLLKTLNLHSLESGSPNHELGTRSHNLKEVKRILVNDSQIGAEWR